MKERFWSKIKILPLLLSLLLLVSCSARRTNTAILHSGFECEARWSFDGERFSVIADVSPTISGKRDIHILFTSPPELCDVELTRCDGLLSLRSGDMSLDTLPVQYICLLELLSPIGAFEYICADDKSLCYSNQNARWYFDIDSGLPIYAEHDSINTRIEITRITAK